jgi:hypothetical protein
VSNDRGLIDLARASAPSFYQEFGAGPSDLSSPMNVKVAASGRTANLRGGVMSTVPLDIERKFEQRWAAKRVQSVLAAAPEKHVPASQPEQPSVPPIVEQAAEKLRPAV